MVVNKKKKINFNFLLNNNNIARCGIFKILNIFFKIDFIFKRYKNKMTNNIKTMNIIKFLEEREIQYIYIQLDYTKTEPFITKPNVSKDNMFYYDNGKNMNNSPNKIFNHPNKE